MSLDNREVLCNKYGFSPLNMLRTALTQREGWVELGIPLPDEASEEEM